MTGVFPAWLPCRYAGCTQTAEVLDVWFWEAAGEDRLIPHISIQCPQRHHFWGIPLDKL